MKTSTVIAAAIVVWTQALMAQIPQEKKPVPKDSDACLFPGAPRATFSRPVPACATWWRASTSAQACICV